MNGTLAKIQRLLDQESTEFHRQAAELVIALADPEVDAWVLATTDWSESNDPETWDRGPMPSPRNRMLGADALSEVLSRSGSDAVPSRLFLTAPSARGFARMPGLTELVLKAGTFRRRDWAEAGDHELRRVADLDELAVLTALTDVALVGAADVPLDMFARFPALRRLSLYRCTIASGMADLSAGGLLRLDLAKVSGLRALTVPPTLRELHIDGAPDLTGVDGLAAATSLTRLSCVDATGLAALPPLPPLHEIRLSGCTALRSLDGFQAVRNGGSIRLDGCAAIDDLAPLAVSGPVAVTVLDLRGLPALADLTSIAEWPEPGVVALHGTATRPDTVPPGLLPACTWAHTPDLDVLGRRLSRA